MDESDFPEAVKSDILFPNLVSLSLTDADGDPKVRPTVSDAICAHQKLCLRFSHLEF